MSDKEIIDKLESWLDDRYNDYVRCFRTGAGDSLMGTRALEVMDIRIKLNQLIEESCQEIVNHGQS